MFYTRESISWHTKEKIENTEVDSFCTYRYSSNKDLQKKRGLTLTINENVSIYKKNNTKRMRGLLSATSSYIRSKDQRLVFKYTNRDVTSSNTLVLSERTIPNFHFHHKIE